MNPPPDAQQGPAPAAVRERSPWTMLIALVSAFAMSQAYRTTAAIMAPPLQQEFALTEQALGLFAGTFHFAFGTLQLAMGIGIDLRGLRRTVLTAFPLTMVGAVLAAAAPDFRLLLLGQALIGIGGVGNETHTDRGLGDIRGGGGTDGQLRG